MTRDEGNDFSTSVSADGRTLIFSRLFGGGNARREIWTVPLEGEHTPAPLLEGQFAGPGPKTPVSIGGDQEVVWSPDGREL